MAVQCVITFWRVFAIQVMSFCAFLTFRKSLKECIEIHFIGNFALNSGLSRIDTCPYSSPATVKNKENFIRVRDLGLFMNFASNLSALEEE